MHSLWRGLAVGVSLLALGSTIAKAEPKVVASIQPIHSLVAGVMSGVAEPALLVKGGGSPHSYALRPSEAQALNDAQVIFWVGEGLETFLEKPLETLGEGARIVELIDAPGVKRIEYGDHDHDHDHGHEHGEHDHDDHDHDDHEAHEDHASGHDHDHDHDHGAFDPHIWLDTENALVMVDAIHNALAEADPANAESYGMNAERLSARLRALDHNLHEMLEPVEGKPFVVFHDAYQYFEDRYHLNKVSAITINPERKPGASHLKEVQDKIAESGAACVFAEPQFQPKVVDTVIQGMDVKKGVLDPLGAALEPGEDAYFKLMEGLANSLTDCLNS